MLRSRLLSRIRSSGRGAIPMPTTVLLTHEDILRRTREMAAEIRRDYADAGQLHIVCVLKGAFMFLADLARAIDMPVTLDFMALSSYVKATTSSGEVRVLKDLDSAVEGRQVLIVEDIVDTGLTLHYLQEILAARGPRSIRTACLLNKPSRRLIEVRVEYIGFTIEDQFVVGYGLDFDERYRNLPYIAVLEGDA
jgi:hypoxanthine phosphoribosyltransferase